MIEGQFFGYHVGVKIGESAYTSSYEATRQDGNQKAALHVLHSKFAENVNIRHRLTETLKRLAELKIPGVLRIFAADLSTPTAVWLSERSTGTPVSALVQAHGALPLPHVVAAVERIGTIVSNLHANGVVHGAIGAENIFMNAQGDGQLAETGVADVLRMELALENQAPHLEQRIRDDVLSVGNLAYWLATGTLPEADSPADPRTIRGDIPQDVALVLHAAVQGHFVAIDPFCQALKSAFAANAAEAQAESPTQSEDLSAASGSSVQAVPGLSASDSDLRFSQPNSFDTEPPEAALAFTSEPPLENGVTPAAQSGQVLQPMDATRGDDPILWDWLQENGIGSLYDRLLAQGLEVDLLLKLKPPQIEQLGIPETGLRLKLIEAIAEEHKKRRKETVANAAEAANLAMQRAKSKGQEMVESGAKGSARLLDRLRNTSRKTKAVAFTLMFSMFFVLPVTLWWLKAPLEFGENYPFAVRIARFRSPFDAIKYLGKVQNYTLEETKIKAEIFEEEDDGRWFSIITSPSERYAEAETEGRKLQPIIQLNSPPGIVSFESWKAKRLLPEHFPPTKASENTDLSGLANSDLTNLIDKLPFSEEVEISTLTLYSDLSKTDGLKNHVALTSSVKSFLPKNLDRSFVLQHSNAFLEAEILDPLTGATVLLSAFRVKEKSDFTEKEFAGKGGFRVNMDFILDPLEYTADKIEKSKKAVAKDKYIARDESYIGGYVFEYYGMTGKHAVVSDPEKKSIFILYEKMSGGGFYLLDHLAKKIGLSAGRQFSILSSLPPVTQKNPVYEDDWVGAHLKLLDSDDAKKSKLTTWSREAVGHLSASMYYHSPGDGYWEASSVLFVDEEQAKRFLKLKNGEDELLETDFGPSYLVSEQRPKPDEPWLSYAVPYSFSLSKEKYVFAFGNRSSKSKYSGRLSMDQLKERIGRSQAFHKPSSQEKGEGFDVYGWLSGIEQSCELPEISRQQLKQIGSSDINDINPAMTEYVKKVGTRKSRLDATVKMDFVAADFLAVPLRSLVIKKKNGEIEYFDLVSDEKPELVREKISAAVKFVKTMQIVDGTKTLKGIKVIKSNGSSLLRCEF